MIYINNEFHHAALKLIYDKPLRAKTVIHSTEMAGRPSS